jgi:hypothetical protein
LISHQIPRSRIWLDQIDERAALLNGKQPASYAVRSQHHANLRSLADLGAAFATGAQLRQAADDKVETDDGPCATVACYFI